VQGIFMLRFLAVAALAPSQTLSTAVAAAGWLCIIVAIYLLNGLSDLEGDRLNGSRRPLASGRLDPATAWAMTAALAVAGLAVCSAHSANLGTLASCMLLLGGGYSYGPCWKASRHAAGIVIGAAAAITYAAGAVAVDAASWQLLAFTTSVSAWIAFACAAKDLSDVAGDRAMGRQTAPIALGLDGARRRLAAATTVAAAAVLMISAVLGIYGLPALAIALGTTVLALSLTIKQRPLCSRRPRAPYRVYMVTQYAACAGLAAGLTT
jgi:4-hydroxybenzoate polyprenyltransferase